MRRGLGAVAIIVAGAVFLTSGPMGTVARADSTSAKSTKAASAGSTADTPTQTPSGTPAGPPSTTAAAHPSAPSGTPATPATKPATKPTTTPTPKPSSPAPSGASSPTSPPIIPGLSPDAAPPPCPPNSNDASVPANGGAQCIAENVMSTRWNLGYAWSPASGTYTPTPCVSDPRALIPNGIYRIEDCKPWGLQGENIAQTRVVAQLNAAGVYGDSSATGITPNLQWEVVLPTSGDRPDLLLYDRTNPAGKVGLVEMKGDWSADDPVAEVTQYVKDWPAGGRQAVAYHFASPISDDFEIRFGKPCKYAPNIWPGYKFHTYSDPAHDGVIRVSRTLKECPPRQKGSDQDEKDHTYKGTIGADTDHNNVDDFWDYIRAHPELWLLPGAIPVISFHPLAQPVKVSLDEDALIEIEEEVTESGLTADEEAIWNAIVDRLPELAASAQGDILAGDGAALGLDAAELAAAEAALDAGFITLSSVFLVPVIAAAVVVAIWAIMHWHLFGDPHMATLDGLTYDLQAEGEFHIVRVPSLNLDVQARLLPNSNETTYTWATAVAFNVNGNYVELGRNGSAVVNGLPLAASQQLVDLGDGTVLARNGDQFVATFGADNAALAFDGVRVGFVIDRGVATTGLLGNNDGIPGNDLAYSDGSPVGTVAPAVLDGAYADSWRLTDNESFFTYDGHDTTATFTDKQFPSNVVTLADFPQSDQDVARQTCVGKGVAAGPQLDACMLDVAETGDAGYAAGAAAVTGFLQDSNAHLVDTNGQVTENFDSAVGVNFRPDSTQALNGTTVAGPVFDGSGYSFTVPAIPGHSDATVAFDVYAVGLTSANAQNQTLTVTMSDPATPSVIAFTPTAASVTSGPATITPLGTGTTAQGATFQRYRVSISAQQYSSQLRVQMMPSGFRGLIGTSIAVDDIAVGVTLVPAQTFTAALPLTVSAGTVDGSAASGAGNLENVGSADVYSFTVPAGGQNLGIQVGSCPAVPAGSGVSLTWTLATAGRTVATGGCGGASIGSVPEGSYTLTVGGPGVTGAYTVAMEASQQFTAAVPLTVTADTLNGTAASGAGRFEDGASQDSYSFTVPSGGLDLAVSLRGCPVANYWTPAVWSLVDAVTGTLVKKGGCTYTDVGIVPAGTYRLLVSANDVAGTYTLDVASPQSFAVTTPLSVAANKVNGTATAGAGDFETGASQDIYTFTVPAGGQTLNLNTSSCPTANFSTPLKWSLLDPTGKAVATGYCGFHNLGSLAAGDYRLVVGAGGVPGAYVLIIESPQSFTVGIPASVTANAVNGTATAGAGVLETTASQDIYSFSIPAGGQTVSLNLGSCPAETYSIRATWRLTTTAGASVANGNCGFYSLGTVAAGDYQLTVDAGGVSGTYTLDLVPSQAFAVTLPLAVTAGTVNGTATSGAGNFENVASQDVYTFTVPSGGQSLSLNLGACPVVNNRMPASWTLLNSAGTKVASGVCTFYNLGTLVGDTYQLVLNAGGGAGTYTVNVEASQYFPVTMPLTVTGNKVNGTATPGAGTFETSASQDVYTFTVPSGGQTLNLYLGSCPTVKSSTPASWKLLTSSGTTVASGFCNYYNLGNLAAGSYQLVLNAAGIAGPYALTVEAAQTFAAALPLAVTADTVNGKATTGAGRFETVASQDVYTFTVPSGGRTLDLNLASCTTGTPTPVTWKLVDGSGTRVANGICGYYNLGAVAAGSYQLQVSAGAAAGTYALNVEANQTFAVTVPLAVSANKVNGTAVTGAGDLESAASQDIYTFTIPSGGMVLNLNVGSCPTVNFSTPLRWKLLNAAGTSVADGNCRYFNLGTIAAGGYQLVVDAGGIGGTYTLNLELPQTFTGAIPLTVAANSVNGKTATGAGKFETGASQDVYTFTVPSGGKALSFVLGSCPTASSSSATSATWTILNSSGTSVNHGGCASYNLGTVAAGSYRLVLDSGGLAGTYTVSMH